MESNFQVGDVVKGLGFENGKVIEDLDESFRKRPLNVQFVVNGNMYHYFLTREGKVNDDAKYPVIELVERPKKKVKKTFYRGYYLTVPIQSGVQLIRQLMYLYPTKEALLNDYSTTEFVKIEEVELEVEE